MGDPPSTEPLSPPGPKGWPKEAHALAAIGPLCAAVVAERLGKGQNIALEPAAVRELEQALSDSFADEGAALILTQLFQLGDKAAQVSSISLRRWLRAHPDDPESVLSCLRVDPPAGISVVQLLSRSGSQKLVFLADWQLQQREIVLKQLRAGAEESAKIVQRETQSHPLAMRHANVIETHFMHNALGEVFLVEERLSVVLHDKWVASGLEEAANLLSDVAGALDHLHNFQLVHGDIKPDNLGVRESRFIVLDFGICRAALDFTALTTPTGSLRTRAPELLAGVELSEPQKLDIWALGATVFNAFEGRFPLFRAGEGAPPRVWEVEARAAYEEELRHRAEEEWDTFVNLGNIDEPLRGILQQMLAREPAARPTASELLQTVHDQLQAYVRNPPDMGGLSPMQELDQLLRHLTDSAIKTLTPERRQRLAARLTEIQRIPAAEGRRGEISDLLSKIA